MSNPLRASKAPSMLTGSGWGYSFEGHAEKAGQQRTVAGAEEPKAEAAAADLEAAREVAEHDRGDDDQHDRQAESMARMSRKTTMPPPRAWR